MDNSTTNYLQQWGIEMAQQFRRAWNGTLTQADLDQLFSPAMVFHFHARDLHGVRAYLQFMDEARRHAPGLDLAEELVLTHGDKVMFVFRWSAAGWHPDIVGGGSHSNYCKVVLRAVDGRIAEVWQQTPDFLYLLGKLPLKSPMLYPTVVEHSVLEKREDGIFPTDDPDTHAMSALFKRMNDCFQNRSSLRNMKDIQHEEIVYDTGGTQGAGVQSWKTFAYALHTCLGELRGTRFDDLYVRDGARLRVFLRATIDQPSPYLLRCADGRIAAMKMQVRDGRIGAIDTRLENYIQFLDTDFTHYKERLKNLFQGRRLPVVQAPESASVDIAPPAAPVRLTDVAIVGMAGRFPGCDSVDAFWEALDTGRSLISPIPAERAYLAGASAISHAGFIDNVAAFDPGFFQMLPAEAQFVDPQQRLLMQEIVHSIEDSGHPIASYAGPRTGLFIANLSEDYQKLLQERGLVNHPHTWAGNENAMFPARVARFFNIQGPCHFVNAECTSSLVALHEAARLIRAGEIDQAIIGATNLLLHPYGFAVRTGTLLTEEPQARLFSKDSRGQLRGEAIIAVVLKALPKAQADGDRIYGLVAGSAVNNSGKTLSLAAGNVERQAAVIEAAWQAGGVRAEDVALVECHASGVRGGDFAEIAALKRVFGTAPRRAPVRLATAKAATGHAEAASGLASLVKLLLQFRHGRVAGIHGFDQADAELGIDPARFALDSASVPLERVSDGTPLVAGINAFAAGGYNAHVVIREYVGAAAPIAAAPLEAPPVIMLSAQSDSSLSALAGSLRDYLARHPDTDLAALAATLRRRNAMKVRAALVPGSAEELIAQLEALAEGKALPPNAFRGRRERLAAAPIAAGADALVVAAQWAAGGELARESKPEGRRLHGLPLYPFDAKPCWLPPGPGDSVRASAALHPLVQRNVSNLFGQRYLTTFTGAEPVLAGHVVLGRLVLPGVAYLEMVRAAVADALQQDGPLQLRHVVWLQPIALDARAPQALDVQVELTALAQQAGAPLRLSFAVTTTVDGQPRLHCQGQVDTGAPDAADPEAFARATAACTVPLAAPAQVYATYAGLGIDYGPGYRVLHELRGNGADGRTREVLARLRLPAEADSAGCRLHPSMLDGALHAAIGLAMDDAGVPAYRRPPLPFALERLQVIGATSADMWAWIRHGAAGENGRVQKLDIDLFDADGALCVAISGFASRTGEAEEQGRAADPVAPAAPAAPVVEGDLQAPVLAHLRREVARILQVAEADIDPHEELSAYGFDSINLTELGNRLNEQYALPAERPLNPTIFFEYPTLAAFAGHLAGAYHEQAAARHGAGSAPTPAPTPAMAPPQSRFVAPAPVMPAVSKPAAAASGIAIVGVSGRFPQARDLDTFWDNLAAGRDCITEVPGERWDWRALFGNPHTDPYKTDVRWGGFIDGIAEFDPLFFGISPREAELMDPQQRLLMQHVWHAIEDAGYSPHSLSGTRTGVFLATANSGYTSLLTAAGNPIEGSTITGMVPSVAPNRISFLLNLHGPSEPVETACSSSLVAIHRAMLAIEAGTCDMAIVGGVNTIVTPEGHIGFRKAGMLCEDGRCKTFSRHANGYVRGEGVGVLVLKKLQDAEQARDHIYAVVKASAENHGGRATSLTAPNPKAQAELIKTAFTQAGIDPRSVGYIEAHGTGTELGDPIEVNGLKSAFADLYQAAGVAPAGQHCALGSVKSNIGHLELAAGVAGVIKVLMQLKHKTLAPSLHCEEVNPYVQLDGSPFYLVRETRPWDAPRDEQGHELPRRAGVSSFGFGGANAHVVLEEYRAPAAPAPAPGPYAVVLSARTPRQLRQAAQQLSDALSPGGRLHEVDLADIAYTLQVGRDAMEHRLAIVAGSLDELRARLRAVLDEEAAQAAGVYQAAVKPNRETVAVFQDDEDLGAAVNAWLAAGKLHKLLQLWVKGLAFDWERLYAGRPAPRRVSLPGYPFERERHWVPQVSAPARRDSAVVLHPLAQRNTSDFSGQRYSGSFDGREFFLRDHVVLGHPVLPAAAYLELVRAAVADAAKAGGAPIVLRNVVWPQPLMVDKAGAPVEVQVALKPQADGQVAFQVLSQDARRAGPVVHCEGTAAVGSLDATAETLDFNAFPAGATHYTVDQVYAAFATLGIEYGPAHRCVRELASSADGSQVVARLTLPTVGDAGLAGWVMHPGLLDGALQAGIGFMLHAGERGDGRPPLPFHLKQLEILAPCTGTMQVWVREAGAQSLDLDLCDESGRVCARLRGFASRAAGGEKASAAEPHGLVLAPVWEQVATPAAAQDADSGRTLVIARGALAAALREQWPQAVVQDAFGDAGAQRWDHIVWVANDAAPADYESMLAEQEAGVHALFGAIKAQLGAGHGAHALSWTIVTSGCQALNDSEAIDPTHAGMAGLAGTLASEYPLWTVRSVDLARGWSAKEDGVAKLRAALGLPRGALVLRDSVCYQHKLAPLHVLDRVPAPRLRESAYKNGGVYVVIGGAGGIGAAWTEYMITTYGAQVVWIGRSASNAALEEQIARLGTLGPAPLYLQADGTSVEALRQARVEVRARFGRIDGLVHSALVLQDRSLANMDEAAFRAAYATKVDLSVRMAQAFEGEPLDFVLFFSSLVAFAHPAGQGNYVAGCVFKDAFARALGARWDCAVKVINWGYWGSIGAGASDALRKRMAQMGVGSIEPAEAMDALEMLLIDSTDQSALVNVTRPLAELARGVYAGFLAGAARPAPAQVATPAPVSPAPGGADLEGAVCATVAGILSEALKVDIADIDIDEAFSGYGLDSITGVQLAQTLNQRFGLELDVTAFFDYGTVRLLSGHLLARHGAALAQALGGAAAAPEPQPIAPEAAPPELTQEPKQEQDLTGIAIVGISGAFPMASSAEALWDNLVQGKACVTEVPSARWEWTQVDGDPAQPVKRECFRWGGFIDGVDRFDAD
ncbi:MAG: SDR family NAD(P)-dependent oxidoreductase, partial [Gammaproteobacteria bacterium]